MFILRGFFLTNNMILDY